MNRTIEAGDDTHEPLEVTTVRLSTEPIPLLEELAALENVVDFLILRIDLHFISVLRNELKSDTTPQTNLIDLRLVNATGLERESLEALELLPRIFLF